MSDPRSTERPRNGRLLARVPLGAALGLALLWFGVVSGVAADKAVETAGSAGTYHWMPNTAQISPNGTVEFKNSESIPHGVVFENPPAAPSCNGVPSTGTTGTWSGTCTFTQPGTYKFYCPVHPTEMKGTITVTGPSPPVATTEPASAITETEATLNGKVNPSGQDTTFFFKYGTTTAYNHETTHESAGSGSTTLSESAMLTGLAPATTYHFQMVAEGTSETVTGADRTFTTAGPPSATTEPASGVGSVEATLKGTVNPNGLASEYFFNYGTTSGYGHETAKLQAGAGTSNVAVSQLLSGLSPETTYHFQLVAKNSAGEVKGVDQSFTTGRPPSATTEPASGVGSVEATLKGTVNPNGLASEYFFNYGTTSGYGHETAKLQAGAGTSNVAVSQLLSGLSPETTYHFQLVAKNSAGEVKGVDQSFTTSSFGAPIATTGLATAITETTATLEGLVNPQGPQTGYYFNYGTTAAYGQKTAERTAGKGTTNVGVSEQLTGLSPGTTYHFQLLAHNGNGTGPGADRTFTTAAPPLLPPQEQPLPEIPPAPAGATPPETKISSKPPAKTRDRTPTIKFSASAGGASFQCSVDSKPFKACRSPFTAPALKPGKHRIRVKAVLDGVADPTPASCSFKVLAVK